VFVTLFKKPEVQKRAKGLGARDAGFELKARAFWTRGALLLENAQNQS